MGTVELTLDITDRKKMESALKNSQARLQNLVETIPHGIQEIDPQGTITYANPAHHKIYGYKDQEMVGQSILDLQISGSAKNALSTHLANLVAKQPQPIPYFAKNCTRDGKIIDVQVDWDYKRGDQGLVSGFISIVTDITEKNKAIEDLRQAKENLEHRIQERTAKLLETNERLIREAEIRKETQDALKASQAELNTIFNHTPVVTVIMDHNQRVRKANIAALSFASSLPEAVIGRCGGEALRCLNAIDDPVKCGCGPECKTCNVRLSVLETLRSGKPTQEIEATLPISDGNGSQKLHLLVSTAPICISGNDMVVVCLQDITSRKKAEKQLNELNKELVERTRLSEQRAKKIQKLAVDLSRAEDRERQRLAGILHDDLQQMLAYLKLEMESLQMGLEDGTNLATINTTIDGCLKSCRNLSHELSSHVVKQKGFFEALKWICRKMKEMHGLEVVIEANPAVDIKSFVLSSMLIRSIKELLFNVVKHSGERHAWVDVRSDGNHILAKVKDSGKGCNLSSFRQEHANVANFGLFSIEDRVNLLGGFMQIDSQPRMGFCVTLKIPVDADIQ
jgi:PAS domain S-box-containing protein